MRQTPKRPPRDPGSKRSYDNSSRLAKSKQSQDLIIQTYVDLLAARRGEEVHMDEIAKKSGISERTIFRFFKDKKLLQEATNTYLQKFLQESMTQVAMLDVPGFGKYVFEAFDQHEDLAMAYIHSAFGQQARVIFRKQLNQLLIDRILEEKKLTITRELEMKLAVIVSLVNAKIWDSIKTDFGAPGKDSGPAIEWAIQALIDKL